MLPELRITWLLERHRRDIGVVGGDSGEQSVERGLGREKGGFRGVAHLGMRVHIGVSPGKGAGTPRVVRRRNVRVQGKGGVGDRRDGGGWRRIEVEEVGRGRSGNPGRRGMNGTRLMAGADRGSLTMEFDVGATTFALDTLG